MNKLPSNNIFQRSATGSSLPATVLQEIRHARGLHENGRVAEASAIYRLVLQTYPLQFECLHYLGVAEQQSGRIEQAVELLKRAVGIKPTDGPVLANLGAALVASGRFEDAVAHLDRALKLQPAMAEALNNRGWALHSLGRNREALESLDKAIEQNAKQPRFHFRRAAVCLALGLFDDALRSVDDLLALRPDDAQALSNQGTLLTLVGRGDEARAALARAIQLEPDVFAHRVKHAVAQVPLLRDSDLELADSRACFEEEVGALRERVDARPVARPADAVGDAQPYYLAYQELDNSKLLASFGALSSELMAQWNAQQPDAEFGLEPRPARDRIKVGIVAAHVRAHSVWDAITRGWVCELDSTRFEVVVFHLGQVQDDQTSLARLKAAALFEGPRNLAGWVQYLRDACLDVLLYPEIGMDAMTSKLAALRLAPVQAASWGHPQTTGLPTIDFYLSAELFESGTSDSQYTEKLVRLPNLGCHFEPSAVIPEAVDLAELGVRPETTLYICAGMPYKYTPRHDALFVRIASAVPSALFMFFEHSLSAPLSRRLMQRLGRAFAAAGLDPDRHLVLGPWQSVARLHSLLSQASVFLDTVGFSGFNTVMHAVDSGLPVVTQRGEFMRGRLGSAILERMGLHDQVCADDDEYVALAVRLSTDPVARAAVCARMVGGRAALYRDQDSIRVMEEWITNAVPVPQAPSEPSPASATKPTFSIVCCSIDDRKAARMQRQFRQLFGHTPYELISIRDAKSLAEAFNRGIDRALGEYVIFCHDDIEFLEPSSWLETLTRHLKTFDLVGLAGTKRLVAPAWARAGAPYVVGRVGEIGGSVAPFRVLLLDASVDAVPEIQAVDGLFFAVRRSVVEKVRFDSRTFDGFHCYDVDFSFSAFRAGFRLAVATDLPVLHLSQGTFDEKWQVHARRFIEKHGKHLTKMRDAPSQNPVKYAMNRTELLEIMASRDALVGG